MKTISITIVLASLILLAVGCDGNAKRRTISISERVARNKLIAREKQAVREGKTIASPPVGSSGFMEVSECNVTVVTPTIRYKVDFEESGYYSQWQEMYRNSGYVNGNGYLYGKRNL
jgi:hypothetical protein